MSRSASQHKKVLFIQYSQSGQLTRIVSRVRAPLDEAEFIDTKVITLEPVVPFPFPWPVLKFFNIFPECVYLEPIELKPVDIFPDETFDLIVFSYQVWFLSPSLPATSFLKSATAKNIFKNTPVVTLIGCRNMWTQAQRTVMDLLAQCRARLIDNIVLVDQASTMSSFITTPRWLLSGRKNAFWGLPAAGISEDEISRASRFGEAIVDGLADDLELSGQPLLQGLGAVNADVALIQSERIGHRSFLIWGKLLRYIGNQESLPRKILLIGYIAFLISMILTVVPMILLIRKSLAPLFRSRYKNVRENYEQPSGSNRDRMEKYTCQS